MHYRSPKQCRERFHQNLKPSLNREPISAEEGLMIERMVNEMGKRWAEIARRLGNRSDNAVKNWWNGSMNRKKRGLSTPTTSRTYSGRIEAPYTRASAMSPSRSRFSSSSASSSRPSWTESIESAISEQYSHSRRESLASSARQLSPIYTLPSINRPIETPLTSPAFSEASHATSCEPPSMVSDHNSVCSSSPRTFPSPQLLPLPVDLRSQYEIRRPSVHVVEDSPSYPARSLESLSDMASAQRWMGHQPTLASWHQPTDLPKSYIPKPEPVRDTRMGVNNLLNWKKKFQKNHTFVMMFTSLISHCFSLLVLYSWFPFALGSTDGTLLVHFAKSFALDFLCVYALFQRGITISFCILLMCITMVRTLSFWVLEARFSWMIISFLFYISLLLFD
jgi:Myb-like DNA-binding protein FlbD